MRPVISGRGLAIFISLAGYSVLLTAGCSHISIPNFESRECSEARGSVKEFYSIHFGNDMTPSAESLKLRERFLTKELRTDLALRSEPRDYFTATDDLPKAFRVGRCETISDHQANVQVLLFWKDDVRSDQREVRVETLKEGDRWLIHEVKSDSWRN